MEKWKHLRLNCRQCPVNIISLVNLEYENPCVQGNHEIIQLLYTCTLLKSEILHIVCRPVS